MKFKKILILIIIILIQIILISGKDGCYLDKNKLYFNENVFLLLLSTYYNYFPEEFYNNTIQNSYYNKLNDFFDYFEIKYKNEIKNINEIFYKKDFQKLISSNKDEKKDIISYYYNNYYFSDVFNNTYFIVNYNYGGIALDLKKIIKIFDIIKKDKKYMNLKSIIEQDAILKFKKYYKKLDKFLVQKYNRHLILNKVDIYYVPLKNLIINYPSSAFSYVDHNKIWLGNINNFDNFIVETMHFYFKDSFKNKNEMDKYMDIYSIDKINKRVFNKKLFINNELEFKNYANDKIDFEIIFNSKTFYDEVFANMFLLYFLYKQKIIFYYDKLDPITFAYLNLSIFRSFGIYALNFFNNYKGKNVVKDFIKYFYNIRLEDIKEAYKNVNSKINKIILSKYNLYFVNCCFNFNNLEDPFIYSSEKLKSFINKSSLITNKVLSYKDNILVSINIKKTINNFYSITPKFIFLSSLKWPKFIGTMSFNFLSKYKSREYFVKLKNMYETKEIDKLDYAILSYLDSMVFIYFRNIEQLPEILNKLEDINSDHYFKYK